MHIVDRGRRLLELHTDPDILSVVNVWDAASAKVIADLPQTTALATASHSIAATFGYPDGLHPPPLRVPGRGAHPARDAPRDDRADRACGRRPPRHRRPGGGLRRPGGDH